MAMLFEICWTDPCFSVGIKFDEETAILHLPKGGIALASEKSFFVKTDVAVDGGVTVGDGCWVGAAASLDW